MNRERQRAASHERILTSTARLLRERGLQGATVGTVMAHAGLTVGGFYAHFRSKRALMASAFSRASEHTKATLLAGLENAAPESWLRTITRRYVTPEHRDASPPLCALPVTISEAARAHFAWRRTVVATGASGSRELAALPRLWRWRPCVRRRLRGWSIPR